MRITLKGLALLGASALFLQPACSAGDAAFLEGTVCQVTAKPDDASAKKGAKEFTDKISFANGKASSEYFTAKGFKPATSYRSEREPNEAEFEFEQSSDNAGVINLMGEIRGKNVYGRLRWNKEDGTSWTYDFSGTTN